ncbi:MAG TPA: twin-arginine translocase subunit TatC [Acidimicrobiales bacterium]|nr:twin-arginine translocase subunit TatC [Acidimicrobiales bacterium]
MAIPLLTGRKTRPTPDAMTLSQHLGELRRRLMISAAAFVVAAVVAAVFYPHMLSFLQHPYCHVNPHNCQFYVTSPLDGLSLRIKMAAFGGLVLASPVILWQAWRFVTPGLRSKEKRYAIPFVVASVVLFLAGCAIAYFVFPHALQFLKSAGGPSLRQILNPNAYLSLIPLMMVLFGVTFEFPVVLVALELAHVVSSKALLKHWRWAVIGITVVAGVFTPSSDPISMLALAGPLVVFYFASIGIGKLFGR